MAEHATVVEAFRMVFGVGDTHRTDYQRIVWEQLRRMSYMDQPVFVLNKAGELCPLRAAMTDGRRSLFCDIERNVNFGQQQKR